MPYLTEIKNIKISNDFFVQKKKITIPFFLFHVRSYVYSPPSKLVMRQFSDVKKIFKKSEKSGLNEGIPDKKNQK